MSKPGKVVEVFRHEEERRKNIPTAELQSVMGTAQKQTVQVAYERRNRDLDPQLVWRGKDAQDQGDLVVNAPPIFIQEKVHPKALIDDLLRHTREGQHEQGQITADLFSDFNGIPKDADKTEFYQHDQNWTNRMILGDSLQVMASLSEREGLRGKVQCIYFDPPYGIKFNSNFQWSTTTRDVKDGKADHITREPEQVKAFRDTWRDGIHSYLTYLRDRLTLARDLLTDSGSIFVQISEENVHRLRCVMDEIFGEDCFLGMIAFSKTSGLAAASRLSTNFDYLIWYCKKPGEVKYRELFNSLNIDEEADLYRKYVLPDGRRMTFSKKNDDRAALLAKGAKFFRPENLTKPGPGRKFEFEFEGRKFGPGPRWFGTTPEGMTRLAKANRLDVIGNTLVQVRYFNDASVRRMNNFWSDTSYAGFNEDKVYVVQTSVKVIERCMLMTTDPGDIVLDPTCGSGSTATVAEQWGRRWITIDTSRVALALARARIMGARYPYYLLTDSHDGVMKEAEITRTAPSSRALHGDLRQGFVYERVPRVTLKAMVNNAEIDVIWDKWQAVLSPLLDDLNRLSVKKYQTWEVPFEPSTDWSREAKEVHKKWWDASSQRQTEIDKCIAARAEFEYLYDKPYEDKRKVRVAGPFTVESLSPHRTLTVGADDELVDPAETYAMGGAGQSFTQHILDNLKTSGVQQSLKDRRIVFTAVAPWAGRLICAEGQYLESDAEGAPTRRAAIFIGPEFGTVSRPDLVEAAREAADGGFDVLIACAFNFEAHTTEFNSLGRIPVLKARMNADLHMAEDLKNTGKGNLFVIFGEPDIELTKLDDGRYTVKVNGVDVFHPQSGEVRSDGPEGIACWFLDTDYNEESFFVRHAYFLGANDPYSSLKTTLKAEIDLGAWATLNSDTSRAFDKPKTGRIAVKVINHLGDEVMKVFRV